MSFPVDTVDGEKVMIESKEIGADGDVLLTAEDGREFTRSSDALLMELKQAGDAIEVVADEVSEAIGEVSEAGKSVADEIGDVFEAAGDVISDAADDPWGTAKDVLDALDGEDASPAAAELAASEGVDLASVEGSGKDGRILVSDVKAKGDA